MIRAHHRIRRLKGAAVALMEPFRRADWIDVSLGVLSFERLRRVFAHWPNGGLPARLAFKRLRAHPLSPVPVLGPAVEHVVARGLLVALVAFAASARAEEPPVTSERSATLSSLFAPEELAALAKTLPPDQTVKFRVWWSAAKNPGILVFVSPTDSGEPPAGWLPLLQQKQLSWIAADGFGNEELIAQRMLVAVMGRSLAQSSVALDRKRIYVGGMSGGGRIASMTAPRFPELFSGGLYIVGANFWLPDDERLKQLAAANRYVFITGEKDFNRSEVRRVFSRYRSNGLNSSLLLDLPGYAHEYPNVEQLEQAIDFLDTR
jgi:predicted esterase